MKLFSPDEESFSILKVHEWLAIAMIMGVLIGLTCLTAFYGGSESRYIDAEYISKSGFDVVIKGAVANPGIYHIPAEMKMKEVLALAGVGLDADLRRFNLEAVVKKRRIIHVPQRTMITVYLRGAAKGEVSLPKGSKVEDLLSFVEFSAEADLNVLKKKRRLKSEEILYIPYNP